MATKYLTGRDRAAGTAGKISPLGQVGGIRMAGWSQKDGHLEVDAPSAADATVHVRVFQDDGGCYGVMMKTPLGAHPVAVIEGWP